MQLEVIKITDKIIRVKAESTNDLAKYFLRFQEHYESPYWRGKIFTLGQYRQWYAEATGAFTYYEDWTGFNIPSFVLAPFRQGLFDPLTVKEKELLNLFKYRNDDFYIIGSQDADSLNHELAHGFFYTDAEYKKNVLKILNRYFAELQVVRDFLLKKQYHESVILDEVHAYVGVDFDWLTKRDVHVSKNIHSKLWKLFKETKKKYTKE